MSAGLFAARTWPAVSKNRIAHNRTLFREVNERVEAGQRPMGRDEPRGFRCNARLGCNMLVEL